MKKKQIKPEILSLLKPSGLNRFFCAHDLPFNRYIDLMQTILAQGRQDLTDDNKDLIISANSPFTLAPTTPSPIKKGLLLIHGLFDSPFYVKDIAHHFAKKGFLVRAILLPGHGTVPGDLIDINYQEWLKAVDYGIQSFAQEVDCLFIGGFSLGGMLTLHSLLETPLPNHIKGAVLFAPAFAPRSLIKKCLIQILPVFSRLSQMLFYQIRQPKNYAKYNCYALNAGKQACKIIDRVGKKLQTQALQVPVFVAMSHDDEIISAGSIKAFFAQQHNVENRLVIYSNNSSQPLDKRIITKPSAYREANILNFSHTCLTVSPDNSYLGAKSQFLDFDHYKDVPLINNQPIFYGATLPINIKKGIISRLTYNPDFYPLMDQIEAFFTRVLDNK